MNNEQQDSLEHLRQVSKGHLREMSEYWINYSNLSTWQFWTCVAMLVLPLVILYFFMDKNRALQISFFGFNIHAWANYTDQYGVIHGLWEYPFRIFPFFPISFTLDASLAPVAFMLTYQWTVNHQKNRYLYLTLLSAFFAFVVKPILVWLDFFKMYEWMNYIYLFFAYIIVMLVSIWITAIFLHLQKSAKESIT